MLLSLLLAAAPLACPAPAANALPELWARVVVTDTDGGVRLTLLDETGRTLAERTLPPAASCDELAQLEAVVLGAWAADFPARPATVTALPEPPAPAPTVVSAAPPLVTRPPTQWPFTLGALAGATVDAEGAAFDALVTASLAPPGSRFGAELTLLYESPRQFAIDGGSCRWQRLSLALGPNFRAARGPWAVEASAGLWLSWLTASGQDLPLDRSTAAAEPGLGLAVRGLLRVGPLEPFVSLWPVVWLEPQVVAVDDTTATHTLPRFEVVGGAGVRLRL